MHQTRAEPNSLGATLGLTKINFGFRQTDVTKHIIRFGSWQDQCLKPRRSKVVLNDCKSRSFDLALVQSLQTVLGVNLFMYLIQNLIWRDSGAPLWNRCKAILKIIKIRQKATDEFCEIDINVEFSWNYTTILYYMRKSKRINSMFEAHYMNLEAQL